MAKAYTLDEIHQNRIRIKSIGDTEFIQIYNLCSVFGDLMFFDVLPCKRSLVYASFVHRKDAFDAMTKINNDTTMEASFSNERNKQHQNVNELFVLDISMLDTLDRTEKKPRGKRFNKNYKIIYPVNRTKIPDPILNSMYPILRQTEGQISKIDVNENRRWNNSQIQQNIPSSWNNFNSDNNVPQYVNKKQYEKEACSPQDIKAQPSINIDYWEDWELPVSETIKINQKSHQINPVEDKEESINIDHWEDWDLPVTEITMNTNKCLSQQNEPRDSDEEQELSLTSWSIFNGQPRDWSKLRLPKRKSLADCFPSLKNI